MIKGVYASASGSRLQVQLAWIQILTLSRSSCMTWATLCLSFYNWKIETIFFMKIVWEING